MRDSLIEWWATMCDDHPLIAGATEIAGIGRDFLSVCLDAALERLGWPRWDDAE